jgi:hydroxymethylbilane synthase
VQILHHRRDLVVVPIRGNVDTRLKKLERGEVDGLILAAAGLKRIGADHRISEYLPPEVCVSAPGQGALCLETRLLDPVNERISRLHHVSTALEIAAERAFLKHLGGGCELPIGARAWADGEQLRLIGFIADMEGTKLFRGEISGSTAGSEKLGQELAQRLLEQGAAEVLSQNKSASEVL